MTRSDAIVEFIEFQKKFNTEAKCRKYLNKLLRKSGKKRINTIFDQKIPLKKWLTAVFMISGEYGGVSAEELVKIINVRLDTAFWVMDQISYAAKYIKLSKND